MGKNQLSVFMCAHLMLVTQKKRRNAEWALGSGVGLGKRFSNNLGAFDFLMNDQESKHIIKHK